MVNDNKAREAIEGGSGQASESRPSDGKPAGRHPAAGPHAKEHLTDHDKTPGTGSLPAKDSPDTDAGPD